MARGHENKPPRHLRAAVCFRGLVPCQWACGAGRPVGRADPSIGADSLTSLTSLYFSERRGDSTEFRGIPGFGRATRERARNAARRARPTSVEKRKCARRARKQRGRHGKCRGGDRQRDRAARQHAGRRGQRDECHLPQPRRVKKRTNYDLVTASRGPVTRRRTSATGHVASPTPAPRQGTYQLRSGNGQQVSGNATEDVGNVPSAISHTRTSVEQRPDTTG